MQYLVIWMLRRSIRLNVSYAGLTRVSIYLRKMPHSNVIDCRTQTNSRSLRKAHYYAGNDTVLEQRRPESLLMTHHHLHSSPATCHWGFFEAKLKPVLTIASGDEVTVDTISGGPEVVPDRNRFHVPPELDDVHAKNERMVPGHILTGPIAVDGAAPGDVLEVEILDVRLRQDWGYNMIRPLAGTLPDDFHETRLINIPLDAKRMVGRLPWGLDLPLKPFFGVMGVAPPPAWGRITSLIPRAIGGNLDNKELTPGAKLYLPVFVPGALFSCGDGHGVQGDGEVCVTAIETALQGRFKLTLRKDLRLNYPRAETPTHYMTMAMDPDLDQCVVRALRDMIVLLGEKRNLSREDAYTLCSLAADLRVTQTVNGSKGIHCMIAKTVVHG
jgi:acetamidase/formamidase